MRKIGLTGGIGSGKSTVARIFRTLAVPVFNADDVAKEIVDQDNAVKSSIYEVFGPKSYLSSGKLDRKWMATEVFKNETMLAKLNAIIHPAVGKKYATWIKQQQHTPYTLKEAAILIESGNYLEMDAIIVVTAPEALRIQRVMQRDGLDEEQVLLRMRNQLTEKERLEKADFLIVNDEKESLIHQVIRLHNQLLLS
jgi:dephospho-CoA kinase